MLNWSERSTWRKWPLTQQVFYCFGGRRKFNPMVIMFRPFRRAKLFRFRQSSRTDGGLSFSIMNIGKIALSLAALGREFLA
jgi:hypothetical protein